MQTPAGYQPMNYQCILDFWFKEIEPAQWWKKDTDFDRLITERFTDVYISVAACECDHWRASPEGRLAEIIVLDQFSRNMFRDTARAFAMDSLALVLAQQAIAAEADLALTPQQCSFLYMPFMHSESAEIHRRAVELYSRNGLQDNLDFELRHRAIIERFGRYPHRNALLQRQSSPQELEFLRQPGSSF